MERLRVADADPFIDELTVKRFRNEVFADSFDLPRHGTSAGENAALGIGADDENVGILLFEISTDARNGAAGSYTCHEYGDAAFSLLPDFRTSHAVVNVGVRLIRELIRAPGARDFAS